MATDITTLVPYKNWGYGAVELKAMAQIAMTKGMIFSTLIMGGAIGTYYLPDLLMGDEEPVHMVRILKYTDLGPPPSIQGQQAAPAVQVAAASVRPSIGIPVPVPDAEVSPEQTIMTQTELSTQSAPVDLGEGAGTGGAQIEQDIQIEDDAPPPDFVAYEKEPVVVRKVDPKYPEIALRAGLEGNVYLKVWVDKEGKVRKAVVLKSDAEIFNQAAIDAATQWVFTPAVMQKGPVSVWVSIPFRFRLSNK
ncbi:MAG: energy transducer TonB [Bacteroidetes bacterium]|jgi:protein TonB|nr:energy transducer TonB [Bacteroidota bacterium]